MHFEQNSAILFCSILLLLVWYDISSTLFLQIYCDCSLSHCPTINLSVRRWSRQYNNILIPIHPSIHLGIRASWQYCISCYAITAAHDEQNEEVSGWNVTGDIIMKRPPKTKQLFEEYCCLSFIHNARGTARLAVTRHGTRQAGRQSGNQATELEDT